jgi:hypothetical protein
MSTEIKYLDGRKVYTSTNKISAESPTSTISFSIALGDENIDGSNVPSTSTDERLSLAGLLGDEVKRYNLILKDKLILEMDNNIVSPVVSQSSPFLSQLIYSNDLKRQKEEREILMANVDKEYKKTDIEIKLKDLELKKEQNSQNDAVLTMMGESYVQNTHILNTLGGLRSSLGALLNKITLIHGEQKTTNEKISLGVDNQIDTNLKLLEKLNQELIKDISIDGKMYSKIELEKKKDTEILKNVKDENETLLNESLELVEDFLTDGFDIAFNPIDFIMKNIKDSLELEAEQIKTKYNLKQGEV